MKGVKTCKTKGCKKTFKAGTYCNTHASQKQSGKTPRKSEGRKPPAEYGETNVQDGYVVEKRPDHPNANSWGWVAQHKRVMSEILGRPLLPGENVHHKNGIRDDNRPENLELWLVKQPRGQRVSDRVADAIEILRVYAPDKLT